MSLTRGSSFWFEVTALRTFTSQMMRDKRQAEGGNKKKPKTEQVISLLHIHFCKGSS